MKNKTLAACMIVKNEAHIIERCFNNLKELVDFYCVVDTGSTDGTPEVMEAWLKKNNKRGAIYHEPWKNFAHNRTVSLEKLRLKKDIDYGISVDADDLYHFPKDFNPQKFKNSLTNDSYRVMMTCGYNYPMVKIFSNKKRFIYKSVIHEYIDCLDPINYTGDVTEFTVQAIQDSDRNRSGTKFQKDYLALREALLSEKDPFLISRYTFYIAQTLASLNEAEQAIQYYQKRITQGFFDMERYWAAYQIALLKQQINKPKDEVISEYLKAIDMSYGGAAEATHGLIRFLRLNNQYKSAYTLGLGSLNLPKPKHGFFVEDDVYEYKILDEVSIAAYYIGEYKHSLELCDRILKENLLPESQKQRVLDNRNFAIEKLKPVGPQ